MKLNEQVVSLMQAKKMKALGFIQQSYFYWLAVKDEPKRTYLHGGEDSRVSWGGKIDKAVASAFSVSELGVFLKKAERQMQGTNMFTKYEKIRDMLIKIASFENEASNRAKLLIYLAENKFITP